MLIILLLVVVFFGAKRLPEIGKALGRMGNEYKSGKDSAQPAQKEDRTASPEEDSPDDTLDIEAEIKNQLFSRMPGIGRLNKLKKTAEMVGKVAQAAEKTGNKDKSQSS